jgi:ATP-dependent helicase/nuclease subunit A
LSELFSPVALAEVPLTAQVNGVVIAGMVDRLLVTNDAVTVVDFKTTRRPPENVDAIPIGTTKQMAAYAAALNVIYPGRAIRAAVLYTHAPALLEIPSSKLEAHKRSLGQAQDKFAPLDIE